MERLPVSQWSTGYFSDIALQLSIVQQDTKLYPSLKVIRIISYSISNNTFRTDTFAGGVVEWLAYNMCDHRIIQCSIKLKNNVFIMSKSAIVV